MGLQISIIVDITTCTSIILGHQRSLPVTCTHLLVVRMSRKHNGYASFIVGTVDRRGYSGQQKGTIYDARGLYPSI